MAEEGAPQPLSKARIRYADKMFDAYDENGSGTLDIEEFCQIMQRYDPDIDPVRVLSPSHHRIPCNALPTQAPFSRRGS